MTFIPFDSLEDMQQFMAERTREAQQAMTAAQKAITFGDYAMMPAPDIVVFGYVFTEREVLEGELAAGADQEEAQVSLRTIQSSLKRGYLFGRWFSIIEPNGELGSNHAVSCWPITSQQFNVAASFGWDASAMLQTPECSWLLNKYVEMSSAKRAEAVTQKGQE